MANIKKVLVPDIGDYKDVPVIEVMVKAGDTVKAEQSLLTLETDKATMDVPAPFDGVVQEVKVKVGDKVSQGVLLFLMESVGTEAQISAKAKIPPSPPASTSSGQASNKYWCRTSAITRMCR